MRLPIRMWRATICATTLLANAKLSAGPTLVWNSKHPVLLQQDGHYGRIARIDTKTWIAGFDHQRAVKVRLSRDNGATWEPAVTVATPVRGSLTNTEFLVPGPKDVICLFDFRPERNSGLAYEIRMSRSKDGGSTWSPQRTLFSGGAEFDNGCWEPAGVVLPGGELRVYFANEAPYRTSNEQEISMIRSRDNGTTWTPPERVSFREHSRDGMPVPVIAPDLERIFTAIEDNGLSGSFKPVIIETKMKGEKASSSYVSGASPQRRGALSAPLPAATYAGGPYLRRLPDRRFILSFQMADSGNMRDSRMAVALGDAKAASFGEFTFPFPDATAPQLWNSLFVKDGRAVFAVSETMIGGTRGVWMTEGRVMP